MSSMRSLAFLLVVLAGAAPAAAQPGMENLWGVQVSFTPKWETRDYLKTLFDADNLSVSGDDFRIGFARGRTLGGEWGVVYTRKSVRNGSFVVQDGVFERTATNVSVSGVSIEKFAPFTTIKERVQIGLLFGVGVGAARGEMLERDVPTGVVETREARYFFMPFGQDLPVVPLARFELAGAVIVAPGLKIRASGGFNYPGIANFAIGGVYLFGDR